MIDDTRESSGIQYTSLSAEIVEISKHRTDRNDGLQWARNLRFLAYDDTYDDEIRKSRKQRCAVCHAVLQVKPFEERDVLEHKLHHVCDTPFHGNHISSPEELKTSPMRFTCDVCHRGIWEGSRYHCGQCLSGKYRGNFDLCGSCLTAGKHCSNPEHKLEKIPIFDYGECVHVNARSCGDCESIPLFRMRAKLPSSRSYNCRLLKTVKRHFQIVITSLRYLTAGPHHSMMPRASLYSIEANILSGTFRGDLGPIELRKMSLLEPLSLLPRMGSVLS